MRLYLRKVRNGSLAWSPVHNRLFLIRRRFDDPEIEVSAAELARLSISGNVVLHSPLRLCWSATSRCNLACDYCLSMKGIPELSTARKQVVLRNILSSDVLTIDFSGGEPLLMRDLYTLMRMVREAGRGVTITTNGTLVAENAADLAGFADCVRISIDGSHAHSHDGFRNKPGTFNAILEGIEKLHAYQVPIRINTLVMKPNLGELEAIVALAKSLGAKQINLLQFMPIGDGASHADAYFVDTATFLDIGQALKAKYETDTFRVYLRGIPRNVGFVVVWADGKVFVNVGMYRQKASGQYQIPIGNVLDACLDTLWQRKFGSYSLRLAPFGQSLRENQ